MEKAFDFLRENKDVAFGTVENSRPNLRVFQVMLIKGHTLYFATSPRKEVYRQLQENPAVEILGMKGNISVRMSGNVEFDVPVDIQKEIYDTNSILSDLYPSYDAMVYCSLEVKSIDYYDLTPRPPKLEHYDL
ncbi:MAG: pyridoxamine 5'-phosphate oxidase family protein [Muribaculaceae bacterium]|nr:pyridoxamine 5'-phosphate oxidase family protein [Muribaculaceae bacterium]